MSATLPMIAVMIAPPMMDMIMSAVPRRASSSWPDKPMVKMAGNMTDIMNPTPTSDHTPRSPPTAAAMMHNTTLADAATAQIFAKENHRKQIVVVNRPAIKAHND